MKRFILGTPLGRLALSMRESIGLAVAAWKSPESVGTTANDYLAGYLMTRLCQKEKTFIDVGAHIGLVIAEVSHHVPAARIVAVEAIPEKVAFLRKRFPRVECHACALGESDGQVSFFVNTKQSGYSSLGRPADSNPSELVEIKVPLQMLDKIVPHAGVDVIKIDVEGAELGVLRGSDRLIAESRPSIMFESGPPANDGLGYSKEALWQWFKDRDYAVLVPNRVAHNDPGLSLEGFLESHLYPRRTTNYFAVAQERRDEIRDRARQILRIQCS